MKIDSIFVPTPVLELWKTALSGLDAAAIKEILQAYSYLGAGFRPGHVNPSIAITRIKSALLTFPELPKEYRAFLLAASATASVLAYLAEAVVLRDATLLGQSFGMAETFSAMLLDERLAVRAQGFALLADWDGAEPDADLRSSSAAALGAQWTVFVEKINSLRMQAPPLASAVDAASASVLPPAVLALSLRPERTLQDAKQLLELREKRKEVKLLQRALQASSFERDSALSAKLAECRAGDKSAALAKSLALQLSELQDQFDTNVNEQVNARLSHRLLPWLRPAEAFANAVGQSADTNLLERANLLLKKQADTDRLFGLRSQLQQELICSEEMREKLKAAQLDSLHPLPELEALSSELAARIKAIKSLLGLTPVMPVAISSVVDQFVLRLSSSISLDDIANLRQALQASESAGLLLDHELHSAYAMMGAATSRVYAQSSLSGGMPQINPALKGLPLYAMEEALAHDRACTLVVDGHNVLHKLGWLFRADFEQGFPGKRARQALVQRLQALCLQRSGLMIHLWFDGPEQGESRASENLQIHFSGGCGENRADKQILAYLHHLQLSQPALLRAVVTDDRDEAGQALLTGALAMAVQELALWIA
jgi:predicted RNA-binding protein with PIN domain/pimeloyl-ACP methyl ester carboxylesterase